MSLRYRKRIKLSDGLYINLTKNGISSVSIGKPGMTMNIGSKTSAFTVGIPGTGLSYRKQISNRTKSDNVDTTDYQAITEYAENELEKIMSKRRAELDQLLSLNEKICIESHDKYWADLKTELISLYDGVKSFNPQIEIHQNLMLLARTIKNCQDGTIFLDNSSVAIPLPIQSCMNFPSGLFGTIYVGSGMGKPDEEYPFILGLELTSITITNGNHENGRNAYIKMVSGLISLALISYLALFSWSGFWVGTGGVVGFWLLFYLAKKWFSVIFTTNPIRNFAMAYAISQKSKVWSKELNDEKIGHDAQLNHFSKAALSGDYEEIMASIPLVTAGLEGQSAVQIQAGIGESGELCLLIQLPSKGAIEVKNKLTPGGKESVQEKSEKELNTEYATAVLNLSFFILSRCYSAYPTIGKIRIAGCTQRLNDSTGNDDIETILYFNSTREDLTGIKFNNVNIIKTALHLKYNIDLDDKNHMNTLKIDDTNMDDMKSDINPLKHSA